VVPRARRIGHDRVARLAHKALKETRTIRDIVVAVGILSAEEADRIPDRRPMLGQSV
jgi:fumarate hydratase class II